MEVERRFAASDIQGAVDDLEARLAREKADRFKGLIGGRFDNPPGAIAASIDQFVGFCRESFDVQAVYLEMNGFDINYDRWYFDLFGYKEYVSVPDDIEWLCEWSSGDWPKVTLTGLEPVQGDFAWYHENRIYERKEYKPAYDIAVLLVMAKFVRLVESAVRTGPLACGVPVLATAHEFETIGRFEP